MAWYALVERAKGRAISYGEDMPEPDNPDWERVAIANQPDQATMWDDAAKSLVARPPIVTRDLAQELSTEIENDVDLGTLTPTQRQRIGDLIISKFSEFRFQ